MSKVAWFFKIVSHLFDSKHSVPKVVSAFKCLKFLANFNCFNNQAFTFE
jgi:hypothetical protein